MSIQDTPDPADHPPSKSQRKREMLALQQLGKMLTQISETLLARCEPPPDLAKAIAEYKRLPNKHEAKRRQLQFIGRLMRDVDTTHIEEVLANERQQANIEKRKFHELEKLREELLDGSAGALEELIANYPGLDIQHLRQLIRQAQKEQESKSSPTAGRKLFKYLREIISDY